MGAGENTCHREELELNGKIDVGSLTGDELAKIIDYTLLRPELTIRDYISFLEEAARWRFRGVFVPPCYIPIACRYLSGSDVLIGAPVSFPFGYSTPETKASEAVDLLEKGARELDVVMNISAAKSGEWELVREDLDKVISSVREWEKGSESPHIILKVILETPYLTQGEIRRSCEIAKETGFDFVKTATGLGPGGADVEHVKLMRSVVGWDMGVKASGGIRTWHDARIMILAGANRIGTSSGPAIMEDFLREGTRHED